MNDLLDLNDGLKWSDADIHDLRVAIEHGGTIEDAAHFLCRAGTVDEVEAKAREQGLEIRHGRGGQAHQGARLLPL